MANFDMFCMHPATRCESNMSVCLAQGHAQSEDYVRQITANMVCLYVCAMRHALAKEFAKGSHTQNVKIEPASTND